MRIPHSLLVGTLIALFAAAGASAAPSYTLTWSGSTGTGTTGSSTIGAAVGDVLTLDVIISIDAEGFTGAEFDLLGTSGLTASANSLVTAAGGPPECPQPPSVVPGTCFSVTFKSFSPLMAGVMDVGSDTLGYDMAGLTAEFVPSTMTVGRGVFTVGAGAGLTEVVSLGFGGTPGGGGVTDGEFGFSLSAASATVVLIPEPGTAALMGLGMIGLGIVGRRRQ